MAAKYVHGVFEKYTSARYEFVREVASMAERPDVFATCLISEGAPEHLLSLLHDRDSVAVRVTACNSLAMLCAYERELSAGLAAKGLVEDIKLLFDANVPALTKAAAALIRSVSKHTPELAQICIAGGVVPKLASALREMDDQLRESAATTLQSLAMHSAAHAHALISDPGEKHLLALLVACIREPELGLKRTAAACIGEIAKQSTKLSSAVAEAGALPVLLPLLSHSDARIRRQVSSTVGSMLSENGELADALLTAGMLPKVLGALADADAGVRRNAVCILRDVCKHRGDKAQALAEAGGLHALCTYATSAGVVGSARLPAIMALGYAAAQSPELASAVIAARGMEAAKDALLRDSEEHCRSAAAWALGHCGRHGRAHAQALAHADVFRHLAAAMRASQPGEDLHSKAERCLAVVLPACGHVPSMQALISAQTPRTVLALALARMAEALQADGANEVKKAFLASGGLRQVQVRDHARGRPNLAP